MVTVEGLAPAVPGDSSFPGPEPKPGLPAVPQGEESFSPWPQHPVELPKGLPLPLLPPDMVIHCNGYGVIKASFPKGQKAGISLNKA